MNEMIALLVSYAMIFQSQIRPAKPYSVIFILFILFYFKENISGLTAFFALKNEVGMRESVFLYPVTISKVRFLKFCLGSHSTILRLYEHVENVNEQHLY